MKGARSDRDLRAPRQPPTIGDACGDARRPDDLLEDPSHAHDFAADRVQTVIGLTGLVVATAVGYIWSPIIGAVLLLLVPVIFAVTSEGFERADPVEPAT